MTTKAIVLLSGGQDSATCLAIAKKECDSVEAICFDYGQRHRIELDSAQRLAAVANVNCQKIDATVIASLTDSALTNITTSIQQEKEGLPNTFVPGRNALFLTLAAMVAVTRSAHIIYTGVCQTDFSGYPDCRESFIQSQQHTLSLAMDQALEIRTPLMYLTKAETVQKMLELDRFDWYAHTHTCYEGMQPACGQCPACKLRLKGFQEAGQIDPIPYKNGV